LMAWSRLSVRQRYENRLKKKNRNRLRKNGVPSVKKNDPIPKEKHCLEPLKIKTKDNKEHQCQCFVPIILHANHISCQSDLGQG